MTPEERHEYDRFNLDLCIDAVGIDINSIYGKISIISDMLNTEIDCPLVVKEDFMEKVRQLSQVSIALGYKEGSKKK